MGRKIDCRFLGCPPCRVTHVPHPLGEGNGAGDGRFELLPLLVGQLRRNLGAVVLHPPLAQVVPAEYEGAYRQFGVVGRRGAGVLGFRARVASERFLGQLAELALGRMVVHFDGIGPGESPEFGDLRSHTTMGGCD